MGIRLYIILLLLIFYLPLLTAAPSTGPDLEKQRALYRDAKSALRNGDRKKFLQLSESLREYPLYPYLQYNYLNSHLSKANSDEIATFLNEYSDFPSTELLRQRWLRYLANRKQWGTFIKNYKLQQDKYLQCQYLIALMNSGDTARFLDESRKVWLSGVSLPPQCDPAFNSLYQSEFMTDDLVWQRITLAIDKNNLRLANYLASLLENNSRKMADEWIRIHRDPSLLPVNPAYDDNAITRQIIIDGLARMARSDLNAAIIRWRQLQKRYYFTPDEENILDRQLAILAAYKRDPSATMLLDNIQPFYVDDTIFHWQLITALGNQDWQKLREWTQRKPVSDTVKYRWYYWHARALEQTGDQEQAMRVYELIADQRDYYGFLAADRLGKAYNMQYVPTPNDAEKRDNLLKLPAIQRSLELQAIGEQYELREEWHHALTYLDDEQKKMAAAIASERGLHDLAIFTLASAEEFDYLELRFPIAYQTIIEDSVKQQQLDPGWVYSLVRAESAFVEDIRSPAGALGLMQLMPSTARETARKMGVKNFKTSYLLQAEKNVPIGSRYLKQMLDKYHGNMILATAAYNAGPNQVDKWLSVTGCAEPDIWIEQIPYTETRRYVSRIMFYASIYDWRMQKDIQPLAKRMSLIPARPGLQIAGLSCSGQHISYN